MSTSNLFSAGEISKDSHGYAYKKQRDPRALKEVILDQKKRLDKAEKDLLFLREELSAREGHIKVL